MGKMLIKSVGLVFTCIASGAAGVDSNIKLSITSAYSCW